MYELRIRFIDLSINIDLMPSTSSSSTQKCCYFQQHPGIKSSGEKAECVAQSGKEFNLKTTSNHVNSLEKCLTQGVVRFIEDEKVKKQKVRLCFNCRAERELRGKDAIWTAFEYRHDL